jgi:hypothetical protein
LLHFSNNGRIEVLTLDFQQFYGHEEKLKKAHSGELKCIDILRIAKWMWIVMENKTTSSI